MRRPANEYRIVTCWSLRATMDEVGRIAAEPDRLSQWWPATFLEASRRERDKELAAGSELDFVTKGWLPHTMRFSARVQELSYPGSFRAEVSGDFEGQLLCEMHTDGGLCTIRFEWVVKVHKPMVRALSFLLKPLFYSNHLWVMMRGWRSLHVELARRRCESSGERFTALPPQPTFPYGRRYEWVRAGMRKVGVLGKGSLINS